MSEFTQCEDAKISVDESQDKNLRDSIIYQSINGSSMTDMRRKSLPQIDENKNISMIARKSSTSIDRDINIAEQENMPRNYTVNITKGSRNNLAAGYTTMNENLKCPKILTGITKNISSAHNFLNQNLQKQ